MDVTSQELQFLDLSGVEDDECKLLLSLIDCNNPAVEVLAPEPPVDLRKNWSSFEGAEAPEGEENINNDLEAEEEEEESEELEIPIEGQNADQSIFYPDEDEYGGRSSKTEADTEEVVPVVAPASEVIPEAEVITPEVLPPPVAAAATPDVQYPQTPSNGPVPPPHPHDVGRPVYSPRSHIAPPPPPSNMFTMPPPPPGHGVPPPNMYPPQGPPPSPAMPTVYVAQCHVNVGGFGNGQPQGGAIMPNHHQPPTHPQAYSSYIHMPEPAHVSMKNVHDKPDYEPHHRQYQGNNGYRVFHRERGRSRGRGKGRRREEHERSNSVSSDHSSYSDSGKHYKDNSINVTSHFPGQLQPGQIPYSVQYSLGMQGQYMVHQNNLTARSAQGPPLMYTHPNQTPQFMSGHYHNQAQSAMLAYTHPQMQHHIPDPQHTSVMHTPLPYTQASAMIPPQTMPPHQAGVYIGHTTPENIVVSVAHNTVMDSSTEVTHPITMEEPIDVNVSESTAINPQIMQVHDVSSNIGQSSVYVDSTITDNQHFVTNKTPTSVVNDSNSVTSIQTSTAEIDSSCSNTVTVSQSSQVCISEVQSSVPTTQTVDVLSDSNDISTKVVVSNASTPVMTSTDAQVASSQASSPQVPPTSSADAKKKTITSAPPGIVPTVKSPRDVTNSKNTLVVDMSTKLQITTLPSQGYQSIGEISFMEDDSNLALDDIDVISCVDKPKVKVLSTPPAVTKVNSSPVVVNSSPASQGSNKTDKDRLSPDLDPSKNKTVEEVPEVAISPPGGAWAQKKSWAKLFKPNEDLNGKRVAFVAPFVNDITKADDISPSSIDHVVHVTMSDQPLSDGDIDKAKIGGVLKIFVQNHYAVPLQPRGLINKGYWCYVNAPLQALLACPPFYNLCTSIPNVAGLKKGKSSTPVIDSMVEFVCEFSPVANMLKVNKKDRSTSQALRKDQDIMPGQAFEPTYVYKMLSEISGEQFKEGRQQDAEEMLSCVLNGLHDEMVSALKLAGVKTASESVNGTMNGDGLSHASDQDEEIIDSDSEEWQVIGPRKKSCVTRTAHFTPSPISEIFWGQLRFVQQKGSGNTTANLQPFTTLPLDIQSPKVEDVRHALEQLVSREDITYTCSKTKEELTVSKQVWLEHLPQVMILQLKRFIYNKDGGLQKYTKRISFTIDLEITKELLSPGSRSKYTNNQRKYKLLAVIYHDGKEATKGHYVADIYHSGYNCWLHYDDAVVKPVSESVVLKHAPPCVPYLLFYRRVDTMSGPSAKQKT